MLCHGDRTGDQTMIELMANYIRDKYNKPGAVFIHLAHRLDRPVSGVLIGCKTSKSLSRMTQLFKGRSIKKNYLALSTSAPDRLDGQVSNFLIKNPSKNKSFAVDNPKSDAKLAVTQYRVIAEIGARHLFYLQPQTGRAHQLRVHMASIGCPILGDQKYGSKALSDRSIALHCYQIKFAHPVQKRALTVTAPLPKSPYWKPFREFVVEDKF